MHVAPRNDHQDYLDALKDAVSMTAQMMPADEVLAVTAQFVGMIIAAQDRDTMTPDKAGAIVRRNIEIGNATCIAEYLKRDR